MVSNKQVLFAFYIIKDKRKNNIHFIIFICAHSRSLQGALHIRIIVIINNKSPSLIPFTACSATASSLDCLLHRSLCAPCSSTDDFAFASSRRRLLDFVRRPRRAPTMHCLVCYNPIITIERHLFWLKLRSGKRCACNMHGLQRCSK